ncbi:MAG: DUF4160 domain-containing protein [Acidobacteriota bacterium]
MPELSRFYGIVIKMYFDDHRPQHFHAEYGEHEAVINIGTLAVIAGHLPPRAMGLVSEWASLHQTELMAAWQSAESLEPVGKIDPLP